MAETAFGARLANALEDGVISDEELAELDRIARFAKVPLSIFIRQRWSDQSLGLLRSLFVEATETGHLSKSLWNNLLQSAQKLGIGRAELIDAVKPMGLSFAEHVLVDAKSDGHVSEEEERYLAWLIQNLELPPEFHRYVSSEVKRVRTRERLMQGTCQACRSLRMSISMPESCCTSQATLRC